MLTISNYRKAVCQLTDRNVMCVDVAAKNGLNVTIDCRKLPELVVNVAYQVKLAKAAAPREPENK